MHSTIEDGWFYIHIHVVSATCAREYLLKQSRLPVYQSLLHGVAAVYGKE